MKKKTGAVIILLLVLAAVIIWFLSGRNHAPEICGFTASPPEVMTGKTVLLSVSAADPDADEITLSVMADPGTVPLGGGRFTWQAPVVTSNRYVTFDVAAADARGAETHRPESVFVFLPGWKGIMDMVLADTVLDGGQELRLAFNVPLDGKITYTHTATGGSFDTLANGEVVWRAPRVDRDTTFVVTVTATNDKGEKIVKTIVVSVKADKDIPARFAVQAVAGDTVRLDAGAIPLEGDSVTYSYGATGGTFDTLETGEVVWRAPEVDSVTTFTVTVTAVNEKGETVTKTISVTVHPRETDAPADTGAGKTPEDPEIVRRLKAAADSAARAQTEQTAADDTLTSYTIAGRISDTDDRPMPGVAVAAGDRKLVSGTDGTYRMEGLARGQKTVITYSLDRYEPATREYESPRGREMQVRGNVTMRLLALAPPSDLKARAVPDTVYLSWEGGGARHLYGYNIYRSVSEYSGYARMNTKPLAFEKFTDTAVKDSIPYFYKVSSVNVDDVEGDLSELARVVVPIKLFAVKSVYDSPGSNPSAIAYDGKDIWTSDNLKGVIYRHDWDLKAVKTYKAPGGNPTGLAWDGKNLWSCDYKKKYIYRHGSDMKVVYKFKGPGYQVTDLAWDGAHLWAANSEGKLFKMTPKGRIVREFKTPFSLFTGVTWDGRNLWICSIHTKKIYRLDAGLEIDDSYESPHLLSNGFAWDGKNLWVCGKVTEKIYKFSVD